MLCGLNTSHNLTCKICLPQYKYPIIFQVIACTISTFFLRSVYRYRLTVVSWEKVLPDIVFHPNQRYSLFLCFCLRIDGLRALIDEKINKQSNKGYICI